MLAALNMQLEAVRYVLQNTVNEISVCADRERDTGEFYTMVALSDPKLRRQVAGLVAADGLFAANSDFVGAFTHADRYCLVFRYTREQLLCDREALVAPDFAARKRLAESFLMACVESGVNGPAGALLLEERNINVDGQGRVHFNYFLDFSGFSPAGQRPDVFCQRAASVVYGILTREYAARYDQADDYPGELQVFRRKLGTDAFSTFSRLLACVKALPDVPGEKPRGLGRVAAGFGGIGRFLKRHYLSLFLAGLVAVTVLYAGMQLFWRASSSRQFEENTMYNGLDRIGEVYLGEEDV